MIVRTLALAALLATPLLGWTQHIGLTLPTVPQPYIMPAPIAERVTTLKQVTYAVADLVVPIQGLDYPPDAVNRQQEQAKTKEAWLMDKIIRTVATNTWQETGGAASLQYHPLGMAVVVKQTPEIQAQVAELLATMRRVQNVQVAVEMRLVNATEEYFGRLRRRFHSLTEGMPLFLTEKQITGLLEEAQADKTVTVRQICRLTMMPGQRCKLELKDVVQANLEPMVAADLRYVRLDLKAELPDSSVRFAKTLNLPDGGTAVLFARTNDGAPLLFMVTSRILINLKSTAAASIMPPQRASAPTMPNKVIQASAAELVAPSPRVPPQKLREKQIAFKVSVLEGDPRGSREANTVRTLVDTSVATLEGQAVRIYAGGQFPAPWDKSSMLPFGTNIEATPTNVEDGKLRLDLTVSLAKRGDQAGDRVEVQTESTRTIMKVTLGEVVRLRLGKKTDEIQRWAEITATEVANAD